MSVFIQAKKILFAFLAFPLFFSCSSAPQRSMMITEKAELAYSRLDEANRNIIREDYDRAFSLLTDSYTLALAVDNVEVMCKTALSGIIFKIACPDFKIDLSDRSAEQSFLVDSKEKILSNARKLTLRSNKSERNLLICLCDVYEARILFENEKNSSGGHISRENAASYLKKLDAAKSTVSGEPYYYAYLFRTKGDICMASSLYDDAKENYEEASKIHIKNRYLIEIGMDWYCVARACSLGGKKKEAVEAIQNAIKYDKDAENTIGIALDYKAYSKILLRGSPSEEEMILAAELHEWGEKILGTVRQGRAVQSAFN